MIILQLEKKYWEKTRRKIRKLEKKNPHLINFNTLDRKLATILDKSADILELMDKRFTTVSTLSGSREDARVTSNSALKLFHISKIIIFILKLIFFSKTCIEFVSVLYQRVLISIVIL